MDNLDDRAIEGCIKLENFLTKLARAIAENNLTDKDKALIRSGEVKLSALLRYPDRAKVLDLYRTYLLSLQQSDKNP